MMMPPKFVDFMRFFRAKIALKSPSNTENRPKIAYFREEKAMNRQQLRPTQSTKYTRNPLKMQKITHLLP